jgi:hypothetical protein
MNTKMLGRVAALAAAVVMLCGCSTWESTMSGLGLYGPEDVPPAPAMSAPTSQSRAPMPLAATPQTAQASDWCHQVAEQDRETAAENGFDRATQQRRYQTSYRQCRLVGAGSSHP